MDKKSCKSCKDCPSRWRNFDNLTEDQLERVNEKRFEAKFKAGEVIFKQGSPTSNAIFIISGLAKIYIETENGKSVIFTIAKPGRLITGPGLYVDNVHHYSLAAIQDTRACFVDVKILKELVHENGAFAQGFLEDTSLKSLQNF
jgi:CRP-like cAMP-binding protein